MKSSATRSIRVSIALMLWLAAPGIGWAGEVVAVLSSDHDSYQEAFKGFEEAFGQRVPSLGLSQGAPRIEKGTRVVVAFGGRAALSSYPSDVVLIYCMAPGIEVDPDSRVDVIEIRVPPPIGPSLSKLKDIQPELNKLAVFWASKSMDGYIQELQKRSRHFGVEILPQKLSSSAELPDRLRGLYGKINGIWVLPDPLVVNAQNMLIVQEFSSSNKTPLYAPMSEFVKEGATASVSSNFREIGRVAAIAAQAALNGKPTDSILYAERLEVSINLKAAENGGLHISRNVLEKADKIFP